GDEEGARQAEAAAEQIPRRSARDHYLMAVSLIRHRNEEPDAESRAMAELEEAGRGNPQHCWSFLQKGILHRNDKQYTAAVGDFGVCIGLWPELPWGYFNRGEAYAKGGQQREAVADFTTALERDPHFVLANLDRGFAYLGLKA